MTGCSPVALGQIVVENIFGENVGHQRVIESVQNPGDERSCSEEGSFLTEDVQLRIPVEETSGYELIKYTDGKWRRNGEEDVIER